MQQSETLQTPSARIAKAKLELSSSPGASSVIIDGHDMSQVVSYASVSKRADSLPEIRVDLSIYDTQVEVKGGIFTIGGLECPRSIALVLYHELGRLLDETEEDGGR